MTVAVWVGYDNADGKRRTLGGGATGGHVAVPIFEQVIQAVWTHAAPKTPLAPPSAESRQQLICKFMDTEARDTQRGGGINECFRIDQRGRIADTRNQLIARHGRHARGDQDEEEIMTGRYSRSWLRDEPERDGNGRYAYAPQRNPLPAEAHPRECRPDGYRRGWQVPQRIDPSYIWGNCH